MDEPPPAKIKLDEKPPVKYVHSYGLELNQDKDSLTIYGAIDSIPDEVFEHINLKYLRISCTKFDCINELDKRIANFKNLETLMISKSSLKKIPPDLFKLKKLKELRILAGGKLEELPKEINKLDNLEILDLWRNDLDELPESLFDLKNLKEIYLGENNFTDAQIEKYKLKLPDTDVKLWR